MQKRDIITIRAFQPADKSLIFSTWLKGLRYANDWFEQIDQDAYFKHYQHVVENYISRPSTEIRVACLIEDPDVILGYSVFEPGVLHWVFVKPLWRRIGLSRDLIPDDIHTFTHLTNIGLKMKKDRIFNPFL